MNDNGTPEKFEGWCVVEIMGFNRMAGFVSEVVVAGAPMLRIDVPETNSQPAFTKFQSAQSIYSITPVTEEIARAAVAEYQVRPIQVYSLMNSERQLTEAIDDF